MSGLNSLWTTGRSAPQSHVIWTTYDIVVIANAVSRASPNRNLITLQRLVKPLGNDSSQVEGAARVGFVARTQPVQIKTQRLSTADVETSADSK